MIEIYNDPDKYDKYMKIKYNMYKVLKVTMQNVELALMRSNNTEIQKQNLNEQLQKYKSRMAIFTPEDLSYFEKYE